jgi:hypothetical protein
LIVGADPGTIDVVDHPVAHDFLRVFGADVRGVQFVGECTLPSVYPVTPFAAAAIAAAASATRELAAILGGVGEADILVDADLASLWFAQSLQPIGWSLPPVWDAVAGDYAASDGWLRLHTNAPHHRRAALGVLGLEGADIERGVVAERVSMWRADDLEAAVVDAGGCAAAMRSAAEWVDHPNGQAVAAEALVDEQTDEGERITLPADSSPERPLSGVRVLDLTRVLAGPVATRFLAGLGADVLRIDPMEWDEPAIVPEVTLGKRCARLDLRTADGMETLRRLLADAHIIVHGYRPGALQHLGLGEIERQRLAPGLVDVSLDAYGWTGPWSGRRGFDSLVQMSCGIAATGMAATNATRPVPLPVQALDHATGYLLAAAALRGWTGRLTDGAGSSMRTSLARVARALMAGPSADPDTDAPDPTKFEGSAEATPWGAARRVAFPARIAGVSIGWERPATRLGSEPHPRWLTSASD